MRSTVTEIRVATSDDVGGLVELGWRFIKFTPYSNLLGADRAGLAASLTVLLEDAAVRCWVIESEGEIVGGLLAKLTTPWCAPSVLIACELAWWVDEELQNTGAGIKLLKLFERWAAERKAHPVLSDLVYAGSPNLGDLVERLGYRLVERAHMKEIV